MVQVIPRLFFWTGRVPLKIPRPVSLIWWPVLDKVEFVSSVFFSQSVSHIQSSHEYWTQGRDYEE